MTFCRGLIFLVLLVLLVPLFSPAEASCGNCWCVPNPPASGACPPSPPNYPSDFIAQLANYTLLNPLALTCDPYQNSSCETAPPQNLSMNVCAVGFTADCGEYKLASFASEADANNAGFAVTHLHPCGVCSSLQDLAVYMRYPDMTKPGRKCGAEGALGTKYAVKCFEDLGLTPPCAYIWALDALHTRQHCGEICIKEWFTPYNLNPPNCTLNSCLQCDEDQSGPVFKKIAARTRRRSGLLAAITRPCAAQANITHHLCTTAA